MKNNKNKVIELFFYVLIVIVGLILLIIGKVKEPVSPNDAMPPPTQIGVQITERGKTNAVISNWKG